MYLILSISQWATLRDIVIRSISRAGRVCNVTAIDVWVLVLFVLVRFKKGVDRIIAISCVFGILCVFIGVVIVRSVFIFVIVIVLVDLYVFLRVVVVGSSFVIVFVIVNRFSRGRWS